MNIRLLFFSFCSFFAFSNCSAQSFINMPITGTFEDIPVIELLQIIEKDYHTTIYYVPDKVPYFKVSLTFNNTPLYQALRKIVAGTVLTVQYHEDKIVLIPKMEISKEKVLSIINLWESGEYTKPIESEPESISYEFGNATTFDGVTHYLLSGRIRERYSKVPVIGATIQDVTTGLGTVTDVSGNFIYRSKGGKLNLLISYLGYRSINLEVGLYDNAALDLTMSVASVDLDEVIIDAKSNQNKIEDINVGLEFISSVNLKEIPTFLGEADVIRSIERLPGVSTIGEVSPGFNVRGGAIDQNLILLDEALIFNASHALGFFSIFQPDAVSGVSLYKGNIPAKYGGRLSSVLAVDIKEPHKIKWHGSGGLGVASARIKLEGPLVQEKTGVLFGLRSNYSDWILRQADNEDVNTSNMFFGDGLIKFSHDLNKKSHLSLSAYFSHDSFEFSDDFGYAWNSSFLNFNWRHLLNDNVALSTHIIKGSYKSRQFEPHGITAFNLKNGLDYIKVKSQLSFKSVQHFALFGLESIRYDMHPERLTPYNENSGIRSASISKDQGYETSIYAADEWIITPSLTLSVGLRSSLFLATGPDKVFQYIPGLPKSELTIADSLEYGSGEIVKTYTSLEPRFSVHVRLNPSMAFKASYNLQRQFIHLVSNTSVVTPVDLWQLSNPHIRPAYAHNFSIGAFKDFKAGWSGSLEAFYKISQDVIQYKDFAELTLNPRLETQLLQGQGRAYGIELLLQKHIRKISGQIAYTYSRSLVKTDGNLLEEQINSGNWHASNYDQPHQLNVELKYKFNAITSCQIAFTYRQGRPITPPVASYEVGGILVTEYSERNAFRIPDYHRLDFAFNIDHTESKVNGLRNSFSLSFYNIYARQNAFTLFFRRDDKNIPRAYQLAILGKMFPALTWNINF